MQVHVSNDAATSVATGALVVPVFAGGAVSGVAAEVDRVLGGAIADILASGEITGKPNETSLVHAKDAPFKRVLVVGLGEREKFHASALAKYAGTAVRHLGKRGVATIAVALPDGRRSRARRIVRRRRGDRGDDRHHALPHRGRQARRDDGRHDPGRHLRPRRDRRRRAARQHHRRGRQCGPHDGAHPRQRHDADPSREPREGVGEGRRTAHRRARRSAHGEARHGIAARCLARFRRAGDAERAHLQGRPLLDRDDRAGRQRADLRLGRHLDQAGREHARDEVRHVRRRRRDRRDVGDRQAESESQRDRRSFRPRRTCPAIAR